MATRRSSDTTDTTGKSLPARRASANSAQPARHEGLAPVGTAAPEFTLHSTPDQTVSLSDFRGRPLILAFYPADWSPVCGDQLALYNEILSEFHRYGAELMGISVDGVWCHAAFARARHFHFPLLADFEPKGKVAQTYGAYNHHEGLSSRALFVLDSEGIIRWNYLSPMGVNPGADGILEALESIAGADTRESEDRPVRSASGQSTAAGQGERRAGTAETHQEVR